MDLFEHLSLGTRVTLLENGNLFRGTVSHITSEDLVIHSDLAHVNVPLKSLIDQPILLVHPDQATQEDIDAILEENTALQNQIADANKQIRKLEKSTKTKTKTKAKKRKPYGHVTDGRIREVATAVFVRGESYQKAGKRVGLAGTTVGRILKGDGKYGKQKYRKIVKAVQNGKPITTAPTVKGKKTPTGRRPYTHPTLNEVERIEQYLQANPNVSNSHVGRIYERSGKTIARIRNGEHPLQQARSKG